MALVSKPSAVKHLSAIPRTGLPPIIGETPTTGALAAMMAARIPGILRIIPIETIESLLKVKPRVDVGLITLTVEDKVVKKIDVISDAVKLETEH